MGEEDRVPLLSPPNEDVVKEPLKPNLAETQLVHKQSLENFHDVCVTIPIPEQLAPNLVAADGELLRMQQSLSLFENLLPTSSLGKPSRLDPFVNQTARVHGAYELAKTVLLLPVLVIRLLLVGVLLAVGYLATRLALAGWERSRRVRAAASLGHVVLPQWRRRLMGVTRVCARGLLYCFGFHWIHRIGKPARKETAPIVVSNHVSFIDPIFYFYELFPSIVSKSHDKIFLAGTIIRSMQIIPVDKTSAESRKYATVEIKRRASSLDFPSVLLFPEGTTTNGRSLIAFKLGAFVPGFPVQPVVIRYPFVHFDVSWGDISLSNVMFRMLTQFSNSMEVEYLPVVYPSAREAQHPAEFAERVREVMAQALCVPVTEHTHADLMLSVSAQKLCLRSPASYMVEMGRIEKALGLRAGEVNIFLQKFAAMNPDYSGAISMNQFLEWHHLPRCWISKKIFDLYDKSGQGFITFREFVAASGSISKSKEFKSQMNAAYNACSSGNDGCISVVELEKCLKLSMPSISSAKVKMWFKKLDLYGNGVVCWEEFQTFIEANPELLPIFMVATF